MPSGHPDDWSQEDFDAVYHPTQKGALDDLVVVQIEHERIIMEQAWEDGYRAGYRDEREGWIKNPYRKAEK